MAEINVFGGEVQQWQVQVDPEKLMRYGLSIQEVVQAARRATGVLPAGFVRTDSQHLIVNVEAQPRSVEDLGRVMLTQKAGQVLRLADVAKVLEGAGAIHQRGGHQRRTRCIPDGAGSARRQHARGDPGPGAGAEGARAIRWPEEQVTLNARLFRPANFIETAVRNVQRDLLIGSALVVVVLFLFLFNTRTAFICTTAIPTSLLGAVLVLDYFGVGLNIMVLGGLAIALGEVVDDAIIDTENIFRRLRLNRLLATPRPVDEVVLDASVEVRSSVVYATFIVALVFVPLLTLSGVAGKLFAPLGLAYILAILASLIVALSLTPALCYLLLARAELKTDDPPAVAWLKPRYAAALRRIEKYPGRVVSVVFVVIAVGIGILPLFSGEFIPALREGHYIIHMTAVPGTAESESLRHREPGSQGNRFDPGREVGRPVGRARAERRRHLRHSLQRVRGGDRRAQWPRAGAHSARDPRDLVGTARRRIRWCCVRGQHVPDRAHRGDHRRVSPRRSSSTCMATTWTCWTAMHRRWQQRCRGYPEHATCRCRHRPVRRRS